MTKPNLPTEKKLPTKAESLLAQASATVKKENERKSALTAAGVKDIAKYDSAYAPLKNFDKDITSLYTEINDLGRFYTATDKQLGSAKTNAQKMKNRIGQINSFLDTYGNLYDENTIKAMRSDLADIDSTLTDWLGKASADDYLEKINSPASVDTTSVATAIRDKESERARAERGGRDTTEITNELNSLYDNGGAYGAAAKRRNEYNANKVALATAKAELEKIAEGDPVERQKAWENGTSYQYEQEIANRLTEKRAEIDALEAKIRLYEDNEYADNVWLKVYGSGEDLSAYKNVEYGKNEDPVYYLLSKQDSPSATMYNNFVKNGAELSDELKKSIKTLITDDERLVYNYLLETEGAKAARNWLDSLSASEARNQRQGVLAAENLKETVPNKTLRSGLLSAGNFMANVDNWGRNYASLFTPKATSAMTYAVEEGRKDIGKVGNTFIDVFGSIGNMAPSIAIGAINPIAGKVAFGTSAAANAYNSARKEGKSVSEAMQYGTLVGFSEATLQDLLGGIPGISGASNALKNAAKNLAKPALRALAVYGIDMVGEATEEYLQEILDPMFRNAIFNEDNEVKIFTGEAAYSAMLGALTSAILNIPTLSTKSTKQLGAAMIDGGWYDTLLDNALKLDKDSNAFDLANKLKNGELTASEENIGELLRAYKTDGGDDAFLYEKGTIEKMPNSTVAESVDNLKAETNPSELKGEALVLNLLADGEVSNSKAKKILEDPEAMKTIGADVEGLDTISKKRAVIKEAMQNYIAQNAEKIASNAQKETTAQTATNTATEAQSKDADTFQYKHIVERQKLGTRLLSELEGRTSKTGEKLADKLTAMATSITGDEDANRAVYKLFANPRYAAAASIEDGAGFLEIIRNFKTDAGRNFARQQMSGFINNAATAATLTELLRKDVNVTLENAAGMKPSEGKSAPKGYYDESDHRVAIADNLLTYETLVGTIAHEGFHANGAIDRELVNNFAKTLEGLWGKDENGNSVWEATVKRKKAAIEAYTGKPITTLKAEEEVCAEALTMLFNTQKAWDVMGEMFGKIEGSDRLLNRIKNSLDRFFANFKKRFKGEMPTGKLTTFRENLEHLIKETKGEVKPAKESKKESKKETKKETATDAKLDAELEAELAEETEQTVKPEKNDAVGYKTKPTDSEAETPTETKKAPVEDEEVELVSDLYDAEAKGGRMYSSADTTVDLEEDGGSHMLSGTAKAEVKKALSGKINNGLVKLTDRTPSIILGAKGTSNLPMVMKASHIRENVFSEDEARSKGYIIDEGTNYHGLGDELFLNVIDRLDDVTEAYRGTKNAENPERRENYFLLISKIKDKDGNTINVPIHLSNGNKNKRYNRIYIEAHQVATVFGREEITHYIATQLKKGNLVKIKKRSLQASEATAPIAAGYGMDASSANNIAEPHKNVNTPEAISKKSFSSADTDIITPEQDRAYLDAVNRGDMETAQKMVDEAANEAMPNSLLREGKSINKGEEQEGKLIKMYHGSGAKGFNIFVPQDGALGKGIYITSNWDEAVGYAIDKLGIEESEDGNSYLWNGEEFDGVGSIGEALEAEGYVRAFYADVTDANDIASSSVYWEDVIALVRDGHMLKSADPVTYDDNGNVIPLSERFNSENEDIRYSSTDTDVLLPDTDITHPGITSHSMRRDLTTLESAKDTNGDRLYNYKAMEADEEEYRKMLKAHGGLADNEIEELFNTVDAVVDRIKETIESDAELARAIDFGWERDIDDRAYSPIKQNSDKLYKVSLDFSTMCRKRILQQITQSQIQEAMDKTLDAKESIAVRQALAKLIDMGFQIEVACKLCYVESARLKSPAQIKKFLENKEQVLIEFLGGKSAKVAVKEAEAAIREKLGVGNTPLKQLDHDTAEKIREVKRKTKAEYQPSAEESKYLETIRTLTRKDFTTPEGLENLAKNHYEIFNAYTSYVRNATKSKAVENDTWFRAGDTAAVGDKLIANMNTENGLRSQSWSDFQVIHLLDYIAATIELSTRGAKEQVYTKVPDFVKLMHGTNAMINLSLIPAKEYNGKLEYDKVEGMAFDIAMKLREKYPDVAGTICIGIANEQIQKLLASEDIDYVIPYHSSALNKHLRKAMDIPTWEDYQSYQGEKALSEADAKENAKAMGVELDKEKWHKAPSFSEWFDLKTAKEIAKSAKHGKYGVMTGAYMAMQNAADNYKRLCAERGLLPKFSYGKADFSNEENYWKLLIDRKMVNQETGEIIEQKPLAPKFNLDEITEIMDDAIAQYPTVSKHQDAATEVVTKLFVNGKVRGDMSAEEIYSAVEKAVLEEVDNTTVYNILESAKDLDDGRMFSAEETDVILPSEDIEALNLENIRLKAENEALREQFYKTKIKKPKSEDIERVLTRITKNFELSEEDGKRIRRRLREEYYQPRLNPTNDGRYKTLKGVMSKWKLEQNLESICNDIIESASILPESTYVTEAIAEAKDFLKDKDFIKTSDREVSELYDTLVDKFPEIFSADKNMRTRAKRHRIEEIVALPTLESTYTTITDNAAIELQNFIMSSLIHPNLTYADKVDQRIRDIMNKNMERSSYYRQIIEHETYEAINAQMDDTHKRAMIIKMATRLSKMLSRPTKKNHIPEELRVKVAEALSHLNFGDKYANLNALKESFSKILTEANEGGDVTLANRAEVVRDSLQSAENSVEDFSDQYRYAVKALAEYYNELKTLVPESIFDSMDNSQKRTVARALATLEDVAKYSKSDKANTIEFIKRRLNLTTVRVMENANKVMEKFVANEKELEFLETRTKVLLDNYKEYDQMSAEAIANYLAGKEKVELKHLNGEALEYVYRAVLTINRIVTQENNMLVNQTKARRDALAKSAFSELESQRKGFWRKQIFDKRSGKIAIDQMDPSTIFELFGDTFYELFLNVERGVDTQTRINAEYADYMRELLTKYAYTKKKVNEDIKTFELQSGEQLKLSLGEIMSIYLTARQTDGRFHLVNGGIKITPHDELKNYKKVAEKAGVLKNPPSKFYRLTELDLDKILASLSEENIKFAESISDYLSKDLANELNEVSMRLYGYKMFTNPKYFGLKVSSDTTRNDVEAKNPGAKGAANPTLRSIGATQARKEKAGNRLNIRDVFSMTDDHVSTMSTWAAYVEPLTDFETVLNYKVDNAVTVKSKLEDVFGENAVSYFKNFIDRVNGSKNGTGEDLEAFYSKLIGATRSASTAANLSVIAKQPTSYLRTAQYIPAKTLLKHMLPIHKKGGYTDRMLKYSGLARMKELGYSDLAFGRRVGDTYDTSQNSLLTKIKDWTASGAANADRKTWSAIWAACEDITKNNPAFENVSEAQFYNEVNRLFNEIIMNTQVVRTTFTTPPALLSDSIVNKTIYAFKNEPYKQLNMIYRGFNRLQKAKASKDKAEMQSAAKYLVNGLIGIVFSQAITNVITVAAAVLRGWDDLDYVTDEDGERIGWFKYLLRKYAETSLWDAVSLVPLVGDIVSGAAQGYGVFETEGSALEELIGGLTSAFKKANDEESTEGMRRTATAQMTLKTAQLLSNFSGIPLHTVLRDIRAALTSLFKVLNIESHEYKVLTLTGNPSSVYYKQYIGAMLVEAINNSESETFKGFNDVEYIKNDLKEAYGWSDENIQNLIDKFAVNAEGVEKILAEMRGGKSIHSYNFSEYGTNAMGIAEVIESAINEDLKENKEDSAYYTEDLEKKQSKYYYTDMTDSAKKTIDTLVKNREALNSEFALCASGEELYKSAVEAHDDGISYDNYLEAYLQIKAVESDKDYLGNAVEDSASEKKIAIINAITSNTKERQAMYKMFRVGITAQNNAILDDAIDAKINGNTAAYDAAIERYIINNKGADKKSANAEYEKRIAEIREDLAKLSYDNPAEYERQLEYYRAGSVKKYFSADKMNEAKKEWLDGYTDSLARKLKKHRGDTEKEKLIYAEAAKYGIKERELNKRADKLK